MSKRKCSNCEFDTLGIVTVPTKDWNYCPMCSSELIDVTDTKDENDEDMNTIPINDNENDQNDVEVKSQDSVEESIEEMEEEDLIEDELDRLREEINDDG